MDIEFIGKKPTDGYLEMLRLSISTYGRISYLSLQGEKSLTNIVRIFAALFNRDDIISPVYNDTIILKGKKSSYMLKFLLLHTNNLEEIGTKSIQLNLPVMANISHLLKGNLIDETNYLYNASNVGISIVKHIESRNLLTSYPENIDLDNSYYIIIFYDGSNQKYKILQISYKFKHVDLLNWHFVNDNLSSFTSKSVPTNKLIGKEGNSTRFEWTLFTGLEHKKGKRKLEEKIISGSPQVNYYFYPDDVIWFSPVYSLDKNLPLGAKFSIQQRLKIATIKKLRQLIENDSKELIYQDFLWKNHWIFGSGYNERLETREFVVGKQQDVMLIRTADGFAELIEIKKPLNASPLFIKDKKRNSFYMRNEISQAIGQVIDYLDELERHRDSILIDKHLDVKKIRAKIIIGRDKNEEQIAALRRLNSHLHRIEILTFDQLFRIAQRTIEDQC